MVGFKTNEARLGGLSLMKPQTSVNGQGPPKIKRKIKEEMKGENAISNVASKINPWANLDNNNSI